MMWMVSLAVAGGCGTARDREPAHGRTAAPATSAAIAPLHDAIARHSGALHQAPLAAADDALLLRRASLDLLGRIPTAAELDEFRTASPQTRYEQAIDRMLASQQHAGHLAQLWTDVLLARALKLPPTVERGTHDWLAAQFAVDRGFDETTRELLAVTGEVEADGPAGFLLAHGRRRRTAAVAGETARVFLGTQIQCAQCHDHPDANYSQREFHAFAAHFARLSIRPLERGESARVRVVENRRGQGRLPTASDPPDRPSGAVVMPSYFGEATAERGNRREALADAIVADRRFARAIANRSWAQLMGRGVVEPVDGLPIDGAVPPLLDALADTLVAGEFELDALLRAIVLSPAYRASGTGSGDVDARVAAFAQAAVRPLPDHALLRSLAIAAGVDPDDPASLPPGVRRRDLREFRFVFDDDEGMEVDEGPNLPQALLWQHGELVARAASAKGTTVLAKVLRDHDDADARIDALWWQLYARAPDDRERAAARATVARDDAASWEDLVHAMLCSSEFTTNH